MRIILLRHEERGEDIGFYSNLTEEGINRSYKLPDRLKLLNIDIIFSSPFIRTLQTIYPYGETVNIEYGLYEYMHHEYFSVNRWYYTVDNVTDGNLSGIINRDYKSVISKDDFIVLEDEENLEKRVIKFINYLKDNYQDKTVLLVTHKAVVNKIKDLYLEKTPLSNDFEMGYFECIDI